MAKESKVTQVAGNGTWDSANGTLYKFEVSFENGDSGQYLSKSQDQTKFKVGEVASYEITSKEVKGKLYYTIKPVSTFVPNGGGGSKPSYQKDPETEKRITRMSVLKCATDLVVNGEVKIYDLTKVASFMEQYVMSGQDTFTTMYGHMHESKKQPISAMNDSLDQDLPF